MEQIFADVRFALRTFARRPLMLAVVTGSLALGIGASSAMFSVIDTVLLRPLPFEHPERLVAIYPTLPELRGHPTLGNLADRGTFSWPEFWDVADNTKSFEAVGVFNRSGATIRTEGPPERLSIGSVTPSLLQVLRIKPLRGSLFPLDVGGGSSGDRLVLLSYGFWQSRLGGKPDVVGSTLQLNDDAYTIVGVLPPYAGVGTADVDLWVPHLRSPRDAQGRADHSISGVIGRLRPGVTVAQAKDEVARILRASSPPDHGGIHGGNVFDLQADRTRTVRPALLVLLAASGLLLVVACANVAAILLGAGLERVQEIAVRGALGATRGRIARQLLTESVVLAALGSTGGILLAFAATKGLLLLAPEGVPRIAEAGLSARVVAFAVLVGSASGIFFGLLPALTLARQRPASLISSSRGSVGGLGRGQAAVVVGELALATILLVGGTLLVRTLVALNHVDPGFKADELLTVRVSGFGRRFESLGRDSVDRVVDAYFQRFTEGIAGLPGVRSVAVTSNVPLTGDRGNNDVAPEGWQPRGDERLLAERRFVSANYFQTLGIRIVEGRAFGPEDDRVGTDSLGRKTMIISEGLARRVWPTTSAIGKHIKFWGRNDCVVVGVAADVRDESLSDITKLAFYIPMRQYQPQAGSIIVRTTGDPLTFVTPIRNRIWSVDRNVAIPTVESFRAQVASEVAEERYRARLMIVFASLAALFAAMGVYGVTARSVARRRRDIGVRIALGAEPSAVLSQVLWQGARLAVIGAAIGLVAALAGGRALEGLLYGVKATDPATLLVIAVLVCALALAAALGPGRRATRVSPMEALRSE